MFKKLINPFVYFLILINYGGDSIHNNLANGGFVTSKCSSAWNDKRENFLGPLPTRGYFSRERNSQEFRTDVRHNFWKYKNNIRKSIKYHVRCETIPNRPFSTIALQHSFEWVFQIKTLELTTNEEICLLLNYIVDSVLYEWTHTINDLITYKRADNYSDANVRIEFHGRDKDYKCEFSRPEVMASSSDTEIHINQDFEFVNYWSRNAKCFLYIDRENDIDCYDVNFHTRDLIFRRKEEIKECKYNIYSVILHEMGHLLGLDHSYTRYSAMYNHYDDSGLTIGDINILEQHLYN